MYLWGAPLLYAVVQLLGAVRCNFEILILHTNDMHSRFDETDVNGGLLNDPSGNAAERYGGFARMKTAMTQAQAEADTENVPWITLNGGDTFVGTPFYTLFKEEVVNALLPLLGIDVMSLGNHEFDDGVTVLANHLTNITTPVVASNVDFSEEKVFAKVPNLHKSFVLKRGGRKIGVIGYLTPDTKTGSSTGKTIFKDELESVKEEAKKLKKDGVDILIALGHSGFDVDIKIAKNVPELSLVIGAHDNTFLYTPPEIPPSVEKPKGRYPYMVTQPSGRKVPVITAYAFTKYLGKLWATFDDQGNFVLARKDSNPLLLDASIPLDVHVQKQVTKWRKKFPDFTGVLGKTNVWIDGWKAKCKFQECNLGNFITDAFIDYEVGIYNGTYGWTDAPIAFIQSGAIRSAKYQNKTHGNVTYEEILAILPHKTPLIKVRMLGSTLRKALEFSVVGYKASMEKSTPNNFLHASGIHIVYDIQRPTYQRIVNVVVRCGNCTVPEYFPLDDKEVYTVLMSTFLFDGGDGYDMFKAEKLSVQEVKAGPIVMTDTDAVARFFEKTKVIYPEIGGRITILNKEASLGTST